MTWPVNIPIHLALSACPRNIRPEAQRVQPSFPSNSPPHFISFPAATLTPSLETPNKCPAGLRHRILHGIYAISHPSHLVIPNQALKAHVSNALGAHVPSSSTDFDSGSRILKILYRRFALEVPRGLALNMASKERGKKQLAPMNNFVYDSLLWIFTLIVDLFFREIHPRSSWKIPRTGPVIFVAAPHANQVFPFSCLKILLANPSFLVHRPSNPHASCSK